MPHAQREPLRAALARLAAELGGRRRLWLWATATVIFAFPDRWGAAWGAVAALVALICAGLWVAEKLGDSTSAVALRASQLKSQVRAAIKARSLKGGVEQTAVVSADASDHPFSEEQEGAEYSSRH